MPNITFIPATIDMHAKTPLDAPRKKRLAGYARVSSGSEEQESSFDAQVDYYTKKIQENPDWEFVGIYADEAVSGLSIKNRPGFQNMIADALDGKIDIILTKSVSRLSRNTADKLPRRARRTFAHHHGLNCARGGTELEPQRHMGPAQAVFRWESQHAVRQISRLRKGAGRYSEGRGVRGENRAVDLSAIFERHDTPRYLPGIDGAGHPHAGRQNAVGGVDGHEHTAK